MESCHPGVGRLWHRIREEHVSEHMQKACQPVWHCLAWRETSIKPHSPKFETANWWLGFCGDGYGLSKLGGGREMCV